MDKFLLDLLDASLIPGYTAASSVRSNSVVDWSNWLKCVCGNMRDESIRYLLGIGKVTLKPAETYFEVFDWPVIKNLKVRLMYNKNMAILH